MALTCAISRNRGRARPMTARMVTCPIRTALWLVALVAPGAVPPRELLAAAFRLLDVRHPRCRS